MTWNNIFLTLCIVILGGWTISLAAQDCPELGGHATLQVSDCGETAAFCVPLQLEDVLTGDVIVRVDGVAYTGSFQSCGADSLVVYSYFTLLGGGNAGPYKVETWEVDGNNFQGEFPDINALVDSMNTWDPIGDWAKDNGSPNILGGDLSQTYSNMVVEQLQFPGTFATLPIAYDRIPLGINIPLSVGTHSIEVENINLNCSDMATVDVICTPNHYLEDTIYLGLSGQHCTEHPALPGNPGLAFSCAAASSDAVDFMVDSEGCISYSGLALGVSESCYVVCDDLGFCDTTFLRVEVVFPPNGEVVIATIFKGETLTECLGADNLPGSNFTIYNDCPENSGDDVEFSFEDGSLCVQFEGVSVGVDTACMVYCDDLGNCDSTTFYISVVDANTLATPDLGSVLQGEEVVIPVLENDGISLVTSLAIFSNPSNGMAYVTTENTIAYLPDNGFCGTDMFQYIVCNQEDCDTASVTITVTCNDLKVYNGFSPNGDGVNDRFRVTGLDGYPNCSVKIFNSWGSLVYDNDGKGYKYETSWDGEWNGKHLTDGNYFYVIELNDGSGRSLSGYLLLFR